MSSMRWSRTAWALSLALCCAGVSAIAQSADSLAVQYVPDTDAYLVPRALVADYVVCATEAEALRVVEAEAVRVIAAQDSLVLVLRERSEAARTEASACSRALNLCEGRMRALGAEAEHWRTEAPHFGSGTQRGAEGASVVDGSARRRRRGGGHRPAAVAA